MEETANNVLLEGTDDGTETEALGEAEPMVEDNTTDDDDIGVLE